MGDRIGLDKGAQRLAAGQFVDAAADVGASLDTLAAAFATHGGGFVGAGAGALARGVSGWFATASAVPSRLSTYAGHLATVDQVAAAADAAAAAALSQAGGAGGVMPSGLDLGPR